LDSDHRGDGLAVVLEQSAFLGGTERIAQTVAERWPAATVVAARFADERSGDPEVEWLSGARFVDLGGRRRHFLAPYHAWRLGRGDVVDADVALVLHASGWALGVPYARGTRVVAHTAGAPNWLLSPEAYLTSAGRAGRAAGRLSLPLQRAYQRRLMRRADRILACSSSAAQTIAALHRRPVDVLYPPVRTDRLRVRAGGEGDHVLAVGRLMGHKRFDVLLEAFRGLDERLVVAGGGPVARDLRAAAPANVAFVGRVDDAELTELYAASSAVVVPSVEAFGIVTAEALASGVPVIAPRRGGALEIVDHGTTGLLLDEVTPGAIRRALIEMRERPPFDPAACRRSAERFATPRFVERLARVLDGDRGAALAADPLDELDEALEGSIR
jgi:glycosyltransferase involved in cell wall biosynthesis